MWNILRNVAAMYGTSTAFRQAVDAAVADPAKAARLMEGAQNGRLVPVSDSIAYKLAAAVRAVLGDDAGDAVYALFSSSATEEKMRENKIAAAAIREALPPELRAQAADMLVDENELTLDGKLGGVPTDQAVSSYIALDTAAEHVRVLRRLGPQFYAALKWFTRAADMDAISAAEQVNEVKR